MKRALHLAALLIVWPAFGARVHAAVAAAVPGGGLDAALGRVLGSAPQWRAATLQFLNAPSADPVAFARLIAAAPPAVAGPPAAIELAKLAPDFARKAGAPASAADSAAVAEKLAALALVLGRHAAEPSSLAALDAAARTARERLPEADRRELETKMRRMAEALTAGSPDLGVLAGAVDEGSDARRRSRLGRPSARTPAGAPRAEPLEASPEQRARVRAAFEPFFIEWARRHRPELPPDALAPGRAVSRVSPEAWEEWEAGLARTLDGARTILRRNWSRPAGGPEGNSKAVRFQGRSYPVAARLGGNMEADVYLARDGSEEFVLKVFHPESRWGFETYSMNAKALETLAERKAPVVRLLGRDDGAKTLKLGFERGYVRQGVRALYESKAISGDQFLAFNYFAHLRSISYQDRYSDALDPHMSPVYFNPTEENILYDPWTANWIILDPF